MVAVHAGLADGVPLRHGAAELDFFQSGTIVKTIADVCNAGRKRHGCYPVVFHQAEISETGHAVRDNKFAVFLPRQINQFPYFFVVQQSVDGGVIFIIVRYDNFGKTVGVVEDSRIDFFDATTDNDRFHAITSRQAFSVVKLGNRVAERDRSELFAVIKRSAFYIATVIRHNVFPFHTHGYTHQRKTGLII